MAGLAAFPVIQRKVLPGSSTEYGEFRATGSMLAMPYYLALKAEALYLADHTSEALETISEAEAVAERFEQRVVVCRIAPAPRCVSRGYGC